MRVFCVDWICQVGGSGPECKQRLVEEGRSASEGGESGLKWVRVNITP